MAFLSGGAESHHQCHTVEGRNVSFTYRCTGISVNNWWGVDGYEISTYPPLKFDESNSSYGCVNTLTLTLYDVTLYYSNVYTAYPSTSTKFSTTGINLTVHLSELNCLVNVCTFIKKILHYAYYTEYCRGISRRVSEISGCISMYILRMLVLLNIIQWNHSKMDTIGELRFVLYKEVSLMDFEMLV